VSTEYKLFKRESKNAPELVLFLRSGLFSFHYEGPTPVPAESFDDLTERMSPDELAEKAAEMIEYTRLSGMSNDALGKIVERLQTFRQRWATL
jgi:hypothetical protein